MGPFTVLRASSAGPLFAFPKDVNYWGDKLPQWPRTAAAMWKRGVYLKYSNRRPMHLVSPQEILGFVLGFVVYVAGSGRYGAKHRLVLPDQFPLPSGEDDEWWPVLIVGLPPKTRAAFNPVVAGDDGKTVDEADDIVMEADTSADQNHSDFMRRMGMNPEPEEEPGAGTSSSSGTSARCITTTVYATCAKQGLEETPTAWPIVMSSRL